MSFGDWLELVIEVDGSWHKLLVDDPLFEIVSGVEKQGQFDATVFAHTYFGGITNLGEIGSRADRSFFSFYNFKSHFRRLGEKRPAPTAGTKGADRG